MSGNKDPNEGKCFCVLDNPPPDRDDWDEGDITFVDNVVEFDWAVTGVFDPNSDRTFAYTTGLWHNYRAPELSIFGMDIDNMQSILNEAGALVRDGWRPIDGEITDQLFLEVDAHLRDIKPEWHRTFFGQALWFNQAPWLPFLQIVYPDAGGNFDRASQTPSEADRQPCLWMTKNEHPPSPWIQYIFD